MLCSRGCLQPSLAPHVQLLPCPVMPPSTHPVPHTLRCCVLCCCVCCCRYVDKWRYLESGQEKKKGFLTSDFSKRDEFSNTVRTLQWREQLSVS